MTVELVLGAAGLDLQTGTEYGHTPWSWRSIMGMEVSRTLREAPQKAELTSTTRISYSLGRSFRTAPGPLRV